MDVGSSRTLLVVFHISAMTCVALSFDSRWRFDNCRRESLSEDQCMITIRRWCNCTDTSVDPTCPCLHASASNFSKVASDTRSVPVGHAHGLLRFSNTSFSFTDVCNLTSCEVNPIPCEWSPWKLVIDTCMMKHFVRKRGKCCHPVNRKTINATCNFSKTDYHSVWRSFGECYTSNSFYDEEKKKQNPDNSATDGASSEKTVEMIFLVIGIIIFIFFIVMYGAINKRKPRRQLPQEQAIPLRPTRSLRPEVVVYPEPGRPIAENLLPNYLKT